MCRKILQLLAETDPELHLALLAQLNLLALFGRPDEKITPALKPQERAQRLQTVGHQTLRLGRRLSDHLDQARALSPEVQLLLRLLLARKRSQDHHR